MVLWVANRKVYGAHKLWKAARRAGHDIGRDQVARLMRKMEIEGVSRRRRKVFTTRADPDAVRAPDLVNRNFTADRPDALWVTDLTYVPTRSGMAYVCFIVDAFSRRIVGWRVAANMRTDDGPRRARDGPALPRRPPSRRARRTLRRRVAVHVGAVHRTARRDRRPSLDRHRRRLLRQRAGRDDQRALQDRVRLRTRRPAAGTTSTSSSSPPCRGCTGSTSTASTATATTSRQPSSKQRSTLPNRPTPPGLETNSPSLHQTQGGSTSPSLGFVTTRSTMARRSLPRR